MLSSVEKIKEIEAEFKTLFKNLWDIKVEDTNGDYVINFQYAGNCEISICDNGEVCFLLDIFGHVYYYGQVSVFTITLDLQVDDVVYKRELYTGFFQLDGWIDPYTIKDVVDNFINQRLEKIKWDPTY